MPSTIGKCKLFRIKLTTLLEGGTFLRTKHKIAFYEIKCTFFGRKENTINFATLWLNVNYIRTHLNKIIITNKPILQSFATEPKRRVKERQKKTVGGEGN